MKRLPKYVSMETDRHGKQRLRFRSPLKSCYIKSAAFSDDFWAEYESLCQGASGPAKALKQFAPGSFGALVGEYYRSAEYRGLNDLSRYQYQNRLERMREMFGENPIHLLEAKHIKNRLGDMSKTPTAANRWLKDMKMLLSLACQLGWITNNVAREFKGYKVRGDGYHTITQAEIAQYKDKHTPGSKARLAFALLYYLDIRTKDAVYLGRQHLEDGVIRVDGMTKEQPILYLPIHPELAAELAALPQGQMLFILTEYGKQFSVKGFGQWMKKRFVEAGLPHCSAHGLRKAMQTHLAENGATEKELQAVSGHTTSAQSSLYTRKANQKLLAKSAFDKIGGSATVETFPNLFSGREK